MWAARRSGARSAAAIASSRASDGLSGSRIEAQPDQFHVHVVDPVLDRMGRPAWERIRRIATSLRVIQTGRLRWYLLYLISVVVALLVYLWLAR